MKNNGSSSIKYQLVHHCCSKLILQLEEKDIVVSTVKICFVYLTQDERMGWFLLLYKWKGQHCAKCQKNLILWDIVLHWNGVLAARTNCSLLL